jgi:hypothetical protein
VKSEKHIKNARISKMTKKKEGNYDQKSLVLRTIYTKQQYSSLAKQKHLFYFAYTDLSFQKY